MTEVVDAILGTLAITASLKDAGFTLAGGLSFGAKTVVAAIDGLTGIALKCTVKERKDQDAMRELLMEDHTLDKVIQQSVLRR